MIMALSLVLLGLFFIYIEFFLPGVILGIGGALLLISGYILFFLQEHSITTNILFLFGEVLCLILISRLALWQIKRSRTRDEFYLQNDQEGYLASDLEKELIGKEGIALTDLKPAGHIQVEGKNRQAVAQVGFISKSSPIEIVGGRGSYFIVTNKEKI